jgi:hypothetical protein
MAFRRSVGVGHLKQKETQSKQMKEYAEQLDAESVSRAMDEVELFESRLVAFGKAHEAEIKRDPVLRARLKAVADAAGIDVLRSSRSVWSRTLGVSGKYCYDLASRVVEFCMAEARVTGSLVPLPRIVRAMQSQMPEDNVSAADVEQALAELAVFGPAYALVAPEKGVHEGYVSCQATPVAADVARLVATAVKRAKTLSAGPSIFPPAPASSAASPVVSEQDQRSLAASSTTMSTTNTGAGGASAPPARRPFALRSAGVSVAGGGSRPSPAGSPADRSEQFGVCPPPPIGSSFTVDEAAREIGWTAARAAEALKAALDQADVWIDDVDNRYWFPTAWAAGGPS